MKVLIFALILFPLICHAGPVMDVEWVHRSLPIYDSDPSIQEGGLGVYISSVESVTLYKPVDGLIDLGDGTWYYVFPWDWDTPLVAWFADSEMDTTRLSLEPRLAVPFNPSAHDLPVINITTAPAHLWDPETGIYVFGNGENCLEHGSEWEFPAAFQWYEHSEEPVFTEQIGLRIHGGWTRCLDQKGLRFYFDDYGISDNIEYNFFGSDPSSFRRLIVRTGRTPDWCFKSILFEKLFMELGHWGSRTRDVAVYLNREYWGFYTLRERIDDEFMEHTHGVASDAYDLIKDGTTEHGSSTTWWTFLDSFAQELPFSSHEWYAEACLTLNMTSYIDWQLLNIFGATGDNNGHWNLVLLRLEGEPWQFVMWDEDGIFPSQNLYANYFRFRSILTEAEHAVFVPPVAYSSDVPNLLRWGRLFGRLMENSEFKQLFRERYALLSQGFMSSDSLIERLDEIRVSQFTEMDRHAERWGWYSGSYYNSVANAVNSWIRQREAINHNDYLDFIEYHRDPVEFVGFSGTHDGTDVHLSWRTESEYSVTGFKVYRGVQPDALSLVGSYESSPELSGVGGIWEAADYSFTDSSPEIPLPAYYKIAWVDHLFEEHTIQWVVAVTEAELVPELYINEFLALNSLSIPDETGMYEDWCEIFNAGDEPVSLVGMFLTDDLADPVKWAFPDVIIPARGYLVVWCDSDLEDGPLHTNFKLNASGESLGIFSSAATGNVLIDSHVFGVQEGDVSEGLCFDGGTEYCFYAEPTPGYPNTDTSVALSGPNAGLWSLDCSPNPFNPSTEIQFNLGKDERVSIVVFDINGRVVRRLMSGQRQSAGHHAVLWNGRDDSGRLVSSGTYISSVEAGERKLTAKMQLVR